MPWWEAAAAGDEVPVVRAVRFVLRDPSSTAPPKALVRELVGQPATEANLAQAIHALEKVETLGGVDLDVRVNRGGRSVDVTFRFERVRRRVETLRLTTEADDPGDHEESWRLARLLRSEGTPLQLAEGRVFHPYFLSRDIVTIERHFVGQGFKNARVTPNIVRRDELARIRLHIELGLKHEIGKVTLLGFGPNQEEASERLEIQPDDGQPVLPWVLGEDAQRLRRLYCEMGFSEARVDVRQRLRIHQRVDIEFRVTPGAPHVLDGVSWTGNSVPEDVREDLPLRAGEVFCRDALDRSKRIIVDHLHNHGHPDAEVQTRVSERTQSAPGGRRHVRVALHVKARSAVRIERIWFDGNDVTREDILRQLLVIEEGDAYSQSAIDATVQNLRRSGLFRRVSARTIRGSRPSCAYLYFLLTERDTISIDLLEQTLTFRNVDLGDWPASVEAFANGRSFRGGGQRLRFFAQPDWQGFQFTDRYLHRYALAELQIDRRVGDVGGSEELWYTTTAALGLKAFQQRLELLGFGEIERTELATRPEFEGLPFTTGNVLNVSIGLEGRIDLTLRDAERIPYFGLSIDGRSQWARGDLGSDFDGYKVTAHTGLYLPFGSNASHQHYVLRLLAGFGHIAPRAHGGLTAHQRLIPKIRGFKSDAITLPNPIDDAMVPLKLGGVTIATGSAELRIPIPLARRNALAPFLDAAHVRGEGKPFLDKIHMAAGAIVYFSFFNERLEGFVYGAYPLEVARDRQELLGMGVGGSF